MELDGPETPERKILDALEAAEPSRATEVLAHLTADLQARGVNVVNLSGMWNSFKRLLHRRGYFVATPAQVTASLDEIVNVGEGFDLFDAARMDSHGLAGHRALPELKQFGPPCSCKSARSQKP